MALSEARKRANQRWDAKNTHRFGVKMANREAEALQAACEAEGITPHAFFLRAAREMIAHHATSQGDGASVLPKDGGAVEACADTESQ